MDDSLLSTVLSRFELISEQEVWQLESHAALKGSTPADTALMYALRVSHCVPRLKNLDTLASRWGVAHSGAGAQGLDAAVGSPHWQKVNDFLVTLYLTRFDAIAEDLVQRTEEKVRSLTDRARAIRVLDRAIEDLREDTEAFRSPPKDLHARAESWIGMLTALREATSPESSAIPDKPLAAPPVAAPSASPAPDVQAQPALQVEVDHTPVVCFALEQVGVPIVRQVRIRNRSAEPLLGLTIELALAPDLIEPTHAPIPALRPGEDATIGPLDLRLPPGRLREVLEAERARLQWRVLDGERALLTGGDGVEILAYNEWPGSRAPGALLASFVTPNHPVVGRILQRVRDHLLAESGDGGISGYQSKSGKRVIEQVRALYGAVQDLGISYVGLPASFEQVGQKVRLPDVLLDAQMGNCLDISVLFASCLEQMGLAPIIVIIQGHAFPGVWTVDDRFPEGIVPDVARLRNQLELHQILVFDSSTCVATGRPNLEAAIEIARRHVADDARFVWALDIRTARSDRYLPLPIRMSVLPGAEEAPRHEQAPGLASTILEEAFEVPEPEPPAVEPDGPPDTVVARFRAWKDRLLDLTLHNRLLSFRPGIGQSIPLDVPTIAEFEDMLAGDERFQILPKPPRDERDARSDDLSRVRDASDQLRAQLVADLRNKRLHARHTETELFARARELVRQARTDLEEGGSTTTYAAIGILKWYESPSSEMARFAPLLLVPVKIEYEPKTQRVLLRRTEEESVGNVTLAEKMRRDFSLDLSALLALEPDESGVDVPGLLRSVRAGIQRMPRWEVVEDAYIGHFTFAKFLMWKDLEENSAVLLENHVVRHIAEGGHEPFPDTVGTLTPDTLDETVPPAELPAVVDADSTQLAAVVAALRGRSFVLEGPPGTGKSQTITNLIAAALSAGKTILFVSEKMAALEVVHRRLEEVGLGDYCLELHSNKANKKQVVESLGRSYERGRSTTGGDWDERSTRLQGLRTDLNRYVQALHRPHAIGMSFYRASSRVLELKDAPKVEVPPPVGIGMTREQLRDWLDRVDPMVLTARQVEPVSSHPWSTSRLQEWSSALQTSVEQALGKALAAIASAAESAKTLGDLVGVDPPRNLDRLALLADFASTVAAGRIPRIAWNESAWPELAQRAQEWADLADRDSKEREETKRRWSDRIYEIDLDSIHALLVKHSTSNALVAWFGLRKARAQLKTASKSPLPHRSAIRKDVERVIACIERHDRLAQGKRRLQDDLGGTWGGPDSVEDLRGLIKRSDAAQVLAARFRLAGVPFPERIAFQSEAGQIASGLAGAAKQAAASVQEMRLVLRTLSEVAQVGAVLPADCAADQFSTGRAMVESWRDALPKLRNWCIYSRACGQLEAAGLQELVKAHRTGLVRAGQLRQSLERSVVERWVDLVRDSEPVLRDFSGDVHTDLVAQFHREDRGHLQAARAEVTRRLDARRPAVMTEPTSGSEASTLLGQVRLQRRHMAIRKLFDKIPNLLPRLKPCLLMSPLSVAQYLPATGRRFDIVVFDEASQIGTHDAIGAIGRGEQVVVVGDSRQLPPTSFFQRTFDDDELPDDNDITELESVLDEACRVRIPRQWLGWHYRSRHESLIEFSNRNYYENRLAIYAAARWKADDLGVQWNHVPDGVYQMGKTRTNPIEAERVVTVLVEALRKTAPGARSFGVVTFSMSQQVAVEDLLEKARVQYPEVEAHFSADLVEPVFVKNLENVQGDERDEIFLSVCYGPDERGRTYMNFGPLNRPGGERRLNVAITRARCMLRVFSTLRHEQIDLSKTASVGAGHLRAFLQYAAERGSQSAVGRTSGQSFDSEFERQVHDALVVRGYGIDCQVGVAGYRVDLAVRHPDQAGFYMLGIECDGASYHSAATARDRDRLRQQVLEGLGWRLHRIWSSDWWFDREREIERVCEAVEAAKSRTPSAPTRPAAVPSSPPPARIESVALPDKVMERPPQRVSGPPTSFYRRAALLPAYLAGGDLGDPTRARDLQDRISRVVETESPVHIDALAECVARCFGVGRVTERMRDTIRSSAEGLRRAGKLQFRDGFVWRSGIDPSTWKEIRVPEPGDSPRDLDWIPIEELANAAGWHLAHGLSLPFKDLARATVRTMGFMNLGKRAEERMRLVITHMEKAGTAVNRAGVIEYCSNG